MFYVAEFDLGKSEWLKCEIRKLFAEKGIEHVTIELEAPGNGQGALNSSFH